MTLSMARKFAFQNLKANRDAEIPFILSAGLMFIMFNIMTSLSANEYVKTRHLSLPMLINFGIVLIGIFTFVFVVYATSFMIKRRSKEFALYGILGLEKRHIRKIIGIEFLVLFAFIGIIAVIGGYIFGQLTFLGLNRIMRDISGRLMDYPFSALAASATLILVFILYFFTLLRSSLRINLSTPIQLLEKQRSGEGEPDSRIFIAVSGLFFLAAGYYIALTIEGILSSLLYFFLAALFVIAGTYLLYASFSVIILKAQKRRKSYYKPTKFLSVSGLLYRIKSNTLSLASISVLCAGVIITISATAAIYSRIQTTASNVMPRQYQIISSANADESSYEKIRRELIDIVNSSVSDASEITDSFTTFEFVSTVSRSGNELKMYTKETAGMPNYILGYDLSGYNARTGQNIQLADDEILLCANQRSIAKTDSLIIGERKFNAKTIDNIIPSNYAVEAYCIVAKDFDTLRYISENLKKYDIKSNSYEAPPINCVINWNVEGISEDKYTETLNALNIGKGNEIGIRSEYISTIYEMNGGFMFLGIIVGLIFLTGTILITHYKQMSEGYEDRDKYQTMKKVGLPDSLIKKTSSSQIIWMFYAPLLIATLHSLVASKIVYQLLGLFGVGRFMQYGRFYFSVTTIFFIIYFIIFKITSRAYYKIVR